MAALHAVPRLCGHSGSEGVVGIGGSEPRVRLHLEIFRAATELPEGGEAPVVLMAGAWERWWEKQKGVELARGQCGKCLGVNPQVAAAPSPPPRRPHPAWERLARLSSFK